jgi:phosphatidate cytidylyltransferase
MIYGLHPVSFWIAASVAGVLAITPLLFLLLDKAGKLTPALRADVWTRYKSWLVLAPLMVVPLLVGKLTAILGVGLLATLCYREFARATGLFRQHLVSGTVALGGLLITFAIADHLGHRHLLALCRSAQRLHPAGRARHPCVCAFRPLPRPLFLLRQ